MKKRVDALIRNDSAPSQALDSEVTSVYIFNFVNDIDLDDEAELLEVVSDLNKNSSREASNKIAGFESIAIWKTTRSLSKTSPLYISDKRSFRLFKRSNIFRVFCSIRYLVVSLIQYTISI